MKVQVKRGRVVVRITNNVRSVTYRAKSREDVEPLLKLVLDVWSGLFEAKVSFLKK